jgi:hypothetical protein
MTPALQGEAEDRSPPKLPEAGCHALALKWGRPVDRSLSDPEVEETHGDLRPRHTAQGGANPWVGGKSTALNMIGKESQVGGKTIGEVNHFPNDFHCSVRAHVSDIGGDIVDVRP